MKNIAVNENHLYKKTYSQGKKAYGKYTVIYVLKDLKAGKLRKAHPQKKYVNRIGLTVTKKLGGAVTRNRVKRIIRAAFAETEKQLCLRKGFLIVIAAREAAAGASSTVIHEEMLRQFTKLEMVQNKNNQNNQFYEKDRKNNNMQQSITPVSPDSGTCTDTDVK